MPIFDYSIKKSLEIVSDVTDPFSILNDDEIIDKIDDAIKEYINENHLNDITQLIDAGLVNMDQDFTA